MEYEEEIRLLYPEYTAQQTEKPRNNETESEDYYLEGSEELDF